MTCLCYVERPFLLVLFLVIIVLGVVEYSNKGFGGITDYCNSFQKCIVVSFDDRNARRLAETDHALFSKLMVILFN